jgi:ankyrin repeat protein
MDNEGCTPLHSAARCGNRQITELLIKNNVNINLADNNVETALIVVCRMHHENVVFKLLEAKADVIIQNFFDTAL